MNTIVEHDHTIVTRHPIFWFYLIARTVLLFWVEASSGILFYLYRDSVPQELIQFFVFPVVLLLVNYTFMRLMLGVILYYNKLIIIAKDRIILIESSLILKEDIEVMDISKVVKIDVECHGLLQNLFSFGTLTIEQQQNDVRVMHLVPDPYKILRVIREKTNYVSWGGDNKRDIAFFKV